jgi:polyferredoxin
MLTWMGAVLQWNWVRSIRFRVAHMAAICFVAVEALLGVMCPLTLWEDALRGTRNDAGFIARWMHRVMFYQLPEWVFTLVYVLFALVVLLTFWLVPPVTRPKTTKAR